MSKEYLEALKNIKLVIRSGIFYSLNDRERFINDDNFKIIEEALQRLESIDNARPSEALGLVKRTCEIYVDSLKQRDLIGYDIIEKQINEALDTIKQALIKAQEQEKVLEIIKEKNVNIGLVNVLSSVEQYNQTYVYDNMLNVKWCLTQEEFDTLKKWLREDKRNRL